MKYKRKHFYSFVKRLFDIVVSFTFIILFFWLYLIVALLVSVSDGKGSPFFVQARCGKNEKLNRIRAMEL